MMTLLTVLVACLKIIFFLIIRYSGFLNAAEGKQNQTTSSQMKILQYVI